MKTRPCISISVSVIYPCTYTDINGGPRNIGLVVEALILGYMLPQKIFKFEKLKCCDFRQLYHGIVLSYMQTVRVRNHKDL
jgi:hypothetical protein